ncbi:hypothetical protein [Meiothermus granaticius]|uniref:Uncharacterized protein n=1 Tax=Meiothermus granaticius NBRC 107808 TaxID=1227551 RepID=A0A399FFC9_9DEIN|nr:hypothetical protein [Meiothermus granaticius]RIH93972.1 hypothetical protein Mgrana_00058 [Meiothermus granaticius NBRC 107808]GEM88200.1 hypothetical protein MGR01S_28250 [Meiothermus granaticius NBRC 107808]
MSRAPAWKLIDLYNLLKPHQRRYWWSILRQCERNAFEAAQWAECRDYTSQTVMAQWAGMEREEFLRHIERALDKVHYARAMARRRNLEVAP